MKDSDWKIVKDCVAGKEMDKIYPAMIVDSPWMPGFLGISTIDFCNDTKVCVDAYEKIKKQFPGLILLPDYWMEYGMAAEPSAFGCKLNYFDNQPIVANHLIEDMDDVDQILALPDPDPHTAGLMPKAIQKYVDIKDELHARGEKIRMVCARGPLNVCTQLMGVGEFCLLVKVEPEAAHELIKKMTRMIKAWLQAQIDVLDYVEGIMLLDDLIGFFSEEDFMEFAYPYFKEIYDAFDVPVKLLHNDKDNEVSYKYMKDWGVNLFNFSFKTPVDRARQLLGDSVCILGNVAPRDILVDGTPEDVYRETMKCLDLNNSRKGLLLSAGGGAAMGMSAENLSAMIKAVDDWNNR